MGKANPDTFIQAWIASISGTIGAAVSSVSKAPIRRVQLLLQNQDASTLISPQNKYKGITDCFTRVYHEQGLLSFYRGNLSAILAKVSYVEQSTRLQVQALFDSRYVEKTNT